MKTILLILSLLCLSFYSFGQIGESWISFWDGKGHYNDRTNETITDNQGNTIVVGSSIGSYSDRDVILIKYDSNGQKIWEARWDSPTHEDDQGKFVEMNSAGELIVVGSTSSYGGSFYNGILVLKFDSAGNLIWEAVYQGINDHNNATDIILDNADNIYISGDSEEGPSGNRDYMALKYNSSGSLQWDAFYNGTLNSVDYGNGITVSNSGEVYVVGTSRESGSTIDFSVVKFSPTGTFEWSHIENGPDNDWDHGKDITIDPLGYVYATGYTEGGGSNNTTVIKLNPSNGNIIWRNIQTTSSSDAGLQIEYSAIDSSLVIAGYQSGQYGDFSTLKLDTTGAFMWRTNYTSGNTRDIFWDMCLDSIGNIYVGGRSSIPGNVSQYDVKLVRYDINGTEKWVYTYDGGYNDLGSNPASLDNGEIVIGLTTDKIDYDENIQVIKLDTLGSEIWSQLYEGDAYANDTGSELILDSDYNQIIIGSTNGFSSDDKEDYAIVKMDTLGNQLWEYIYPHPVGGKDIAVSAATDALNNVYVTGYTENTNGDLDITTLKLSPAGDSLWSHTYAAAAGGDDKPTAIKVDNQGNVVIVGSGVENTTFDFILLKYDPNGNLIGNFAYNHPTFGMADFAYDLAIDSVNNYYLCGSTQIASGNNYDFYLIKTNSAGTVLWEDTKGFNTGGTDIAQRVSVSDSGYVYIAGGTALVKYDETGTELWSHNDTYVGTIADMDVDPNDHVALTAHKNQSFGTDIVVYKVDNSGQQSWVYTYNHSAGSEDTPFAVTNAPNGDVYVAGMQEHLYSTNFQAVLLQMDSLGNLVSENVYESLANWEDKFTAVEALPSGRILVAGQAYEEDTYNLPSITWRFNLFAISYASTAEVLRLAEVNAATDEITIRNYSQVAVDISSHKLITDNNQINNISSMTVVQGSLTIPPMGEVVLTGLPLEVTGEGLALYAPAPNFSDPNDMIDFVQWITSGSSLESAAAGQGVWTSGTFVNGNNPFVYIGNGTQNGATYWEGYLATVSAQSPAFCASNCDALATVTASGGYPPYTYQWGADAGNQTSATAINLCPGSYTVVITDSQGNDATVDVLIAASYSMSFAPSITVESCQGMDGEIVLNPTGGATPYTYSWDNGGTSSSESNLQSGNYEITISDANLCSWDTLIVLAQDLGPQFQTLAPTQVSCYGMCDGAASALATGNGSITYEWNDSGSSTNTAISNLCTGYYTVTATDAAGCETIDSVYVDTPDSLITTVNGADDSGICDGSAYVTITGGTPPYAYQWDDPANQTMDSIVGLCDGTYTVSITDANGCISTGQISIGNTSQIIENNVAFGLYPNPVQSALTVQGEINQPLNWSITDMTGRVILNGSQGICLGFEVNVEKLSKGVYHFNTIQGSGNTSQPFIKE
jgi:uncharacterized delta-60 repeat protein